MSPQRSYRGVAPVIWRLRSPAPSPLGNLGFVGERRLAGVDRHAVPPVPCSAKAHPMEHPRGSRGIAEQKDHGLPVREPTLRHLEDAVRDGARLIEDVERRRRRLVLAGKRLAILLATALGRAAPGRRRPGMGHPLAGDGEPVPRQTQRRPLLNRGPTSCLSLGRRCSR